LKIAGSSLRLSQKTLSFVQIEVKKLNLSWKVENILCFVIETKAKISEIRKGSNGYSVELTNVTTNEKFLFSSIKQAEAAFKAGALS